MFVRKKKNRSGSTSVIVVEKKCGKFKELKTIGVSCDEKEIEHLRLLGERWIEQHLGIIDIFMHHDRCVEEQKLANYFLSNVDSVLLNGTQLVLQQVFKQIGFDAINDDILKHLVIARISQPMSKAATAEYLKSHFDEDIELHKIYRYLDRLHNSQQEKIQEISIAHTRRILGDRIGLVFYDVTTLYFETDTTDELRQPGFSKDGKHSHPQVVLGLLVSQNGYPLAYSLFNGSQYEARTMIPVVEDFVTRFKLEDFVVVADSGLMNNKNLSLLQSGGYKFIIGARIKNESDILKKWILGLSKEDGVFQETQKAGSRLIIGYSSKRAEKDKHNRDKGVKRLQAAYKSGSLTKENINKKGYNKFLELSGDVKVKINQDKIAEDEKWDGLKGYLTNTSLPAAEVFSQYNELWIIERAYRITKGTLEIRPMFHFTEKRIEAHVCICFVAYKVYKELERILKIAGIPLSVDQAINIAKTITTIKIKLPSDGSLITKTMIITPKHQLIAKLFDENFWKSDFG